MTRDRLRVATVITRLSAGAGGVALRGALSLDPARYQVTMFAGGATLGGQRPHARTPVLTGAEAIADAPVGDLMASAHEAGLRVVRVPALVPQIAPGLDAATIRVLVNQFAEGQFDVVHTHSAKAGALGRVAAARAGVGTIVHTFHGLPFHPFQSVLRRRAYLELERWLGRRTDAFLAVGSGVASEAIRRGVAGPERVRTIPPAVDLEPGSHGAEARRRARLHLGLPPGARLVGTVGRIDFQKAPEQWIDALATAARRPGGEDVWGVWIGDGPYREQLLARARRRGVASRFRLLGFRDDVGDLLPGLDVFALASRYEGLPCALLEAVCAGVPVVATAVDSVPDLVVPGETGLLVPADQPRRLGRAIGYLLDHRDEAIRMAANARERVGDRYTSDVLGSILDQVYRRRHKS